MRSGGSHEFLGYLYILIAASLWGLIGTLSKFAFEKGLGALEVAFYRALLAWFFFFLHAILFRKLQVRMKDFPLFFLFGAVGITLFYGFEKLAIQKGGVALTSVLLYTAPAWVALLSPFILKEKPSKNQIVSVAITILGVYLISLGVDELRLSFEGFLWGILSGFTYALYYLFGRKYFGEYSAVTIFTYSLPIGVLGLLPIAKPKIPSLDAFLPIFALAFLSTYGAYLFYAEGLRRVPALRASLIATFEPVVSVILSRVIFGENIGVLGYTGGFLIIVSVIISVF